MGVTRLTTNLASANIPDAALGVVFVKHSGEWGTVCDDDFDNDDAKVLLRAAPTRSCSVPHKNSFQM